MEITFSKKSKFFCLAMTLLMALSIFASAGASVYAATNENLERQPLNTVEQEKFSREFENDWNSIFDNAVTYDDLGNVESLNLNVLYAKYGHAAELTKLENQVKEDIQQTRFKRADAKQCAITAIQDTLGVSAIQGLLSGGIVGLLQRKAAAEVAKLVAKYAFKGLLPAAAAASLIWSFGRCMWF